MKQPQNEVLRLDRRTQARIQVNIPIQVTFPGMVDPVTAINLDISWGGVLFSIDHALPEQTSSLRIVLPWKQGERITADAHLIRAKALQDGTHLIAARFFSLTPRSHSRLEHLLKMLQGGRSTEQSGRSGDLVRELEVTANDDEDLRYMLAQIATGRHVVTVFEAYDIDQSIKLSIAGTTGAPGIRLRARVVDARKSQPTGFDWTDLYTLTLEFEHPKKSIKAFVDLFLSHLPDVREAGHPHLSEVPDWIRATPLARVSSAERARRSGKSGLPCVLETDFPEALNRLTVGWGDVEAFEALFRDLVLGDQGQPDGWPEDAWEELELLQNVHDISYGLSAARRSMLKVGRRV
ncbi:PilZ domain-containing protein [uncultured Thiocystis sp.]|jgi:hypothetical protein|uniref:PilZ domain-containing protein n=1 Tax=uncultured Thiocystis sp. TaxID=1202134 RepID=UPI0025CC5EFE|nr:PilZ domain-containing protein [uncultured Thiocystis sp.]